MQLQLPEATRLIMPCLFADDMLFQQKMPIGVWGVDIPGTEVQVILQGNTHFRCGRTTAGSDGFWRVELDALDASYEEYTLTVNGSSTLSFSHVVIGELFLAAGQSNMYLRVNMVIGGAELVEDCSRRYLRMLWMPANPVDNKADMSRPQFDYANSHWFDGSSSAAIAGYSAVAYSCVRSLYDQLNQNGNEIPVGVIDVSLGSLLIEAYLSRRIIEEDEAVREALSPHMYKPIEAVNGTDFLQICSFFNTKIAPLSGFAIRAVLYYQGESNNTRPKRFAVLLDALLRDWSRTFRFIGEHRHLPFVCVHPAPHNPLSPDGDNYVTIPLERWAGINESIDKVWHSHRRHMLQLPIYDIDPIADSRPYMRHPDPAQRVMVSSFDHAIHPLVKRPVGERCAEAFMALLYGKQIDIVAPTMCDVFPCNGELHVQFENVGSGLRIGDDTGVLRGFAVCGAEGAYVAADARIISKDTVAVRSDFLKQPLGVRYAFSSVNVTANLCNGYGMPAVPFRTDSAVRSQNNKDWALCDNTKIWVDMGTFFDYPPLEQCTCNVTPLVQIPFPLFGSGDHDAYDAAPLSGGKGTFEAVEGGSCGARCIRYTYPASGDGAVGFGPILHYLSQNNTFHRLRYIAIDLANPDGRDKQVTGLHICTHRNARYFVPVKGKSLLPGDGRFYTFVLDLHTFLDPNGNAVDAELRDMSLQRVKHLQFTLQDNGAGTVLFDNVRFGTPDSDQLPPYCK